MAYMRSNLAFGLFWLNLIVVSLNIYFAIEANKYRRYNPYSYNLRGTKEKLLEINPNYFLEKEIETPKALRNLTVDKQFMRLFILYTDICAFFFIMILVASFCVTQNECCTDDANTNTNFACGSCYGTCVCCTDCRGGDCNCSGGGGGGDCGEAGLVILIFILVIIVFVAVFFAVKACGKHISRMVAIIGLLLFDIVLVILSFCAGFDLYCCLVAAFSFIAAVCNFLGILLPNLGCCARLSYDYRHIEPINPGFNENPQLVYIAQPQNQKPLVEQYPDLQEVNQAQISKPLAPIYTDQNQGYDNNTNGNGFDAPAPVYQEPNIEANNQVNIPYPSPQ
jgi:hypothetical protein